MTLNITKAQAIFPLLLSQKTPNLGSQKHSAGSNGESPAGAFDTQRLQPRHIPRHFKTSRLAACSPIVPRVQRLRQSQKQGGRFASFPSKPEWLQNLTVTPTTPLEVQGQKHSQRPSPLAEHPRFSRLLYFQCTPWRACSLTDMCSPSRYMRRPNGSSGPAAWPPSREAGAGATVGT